MHLSVGPYSSTGQATHEVEFDGELLSSHVSEGSRVVWGVGSRSSCRVERGLYLLENATPFAVHSVLESGQDCHPLLARLTFYPRWADVVREHPDLARAAIAQHPSLSLSRSHARPAPEGSGSDIAASTA